MTKIKGYEIEVSVAVCYAGTVDIIEEFDSLRDAKKEYKGNDYDYWFLAAEVIDEEGNVNTACWGKTRKEALDALRKVL